MHSNKENKLNFNGWSFPTYKTVYGDDQSNTLSGNDKVAEYFAGNGGNDIIYGGRSDYLFGGNGDDVLVGSIGLNHFSGGEGFDTIVINELDTENKDDIVHFDAAQDKIQLNGAQFKGLGKGVLSEDLFYIGEKGTDNWHPGANDRILYDKTGLMLYYKTDDGSMVQVATLNPDFNTPDLSHLNFFIV